MKVVAGKAVGRTHIQRDIPCQDYFYYKLFEGSLIFALADGAGSAQEALAGASWATKVLVGCLRKSFLPGFDEGSNEKRLRSAFQKTRLIMGIIVKRKGCQLRDFNTTLVGGIYQKGTLVCGGVGDSLMLVVNRDGSIVLPFAPAKGEFINETAFITMEAWERFFRVGEVVRNPRALLIFSDGLMNITYSMRFHHGRWEVIPNEEVINDLISYIQENKDTTSLQAELQSMLSSSRAQELNDDDKSLMVVIFDE